MEVQRGEVTCSSLHSGQSRDSNFQTLSLLSLMAMLHCLSQYRCTSWDLQNKNIIPTQSLTSDSLHR